MKETGIVRSIDNLGRIVLPIELRRTLEINVGDGLEIYIDGNSVVLKKYHAACSFCGSDKDIVEYKDRHICQSCIESLNQLKG